MNILYKITIILGVLFLLYHVVLHRLTKVPITITPKKYYKNLFANFDFKDNLIFYELGCGWGDFMFAVNKLSRPKKTIGYELSLIHVLFIKTKSFLTKSNIEVKNKNFFHTDLSDGDIFYLFLVKPVVKKAWEKIKKECQPGTIVITLADKIDGAEYLKKIPSNPKNPKTSYFYIYKV